MGADPNRYTHTLRLALTRTFSHTHTYTYTQPAGARATIECVVLDVDLGHPSAIDLGHPSAMDLGHPSAWVVDASGADARVIAMGSPLIASALVPGRPTLMEVCGVVSTLLWLHAAVCADGNIDA